jgi:ATP-binding cassette subfamily B (MDR/TAP) protein 1
MDRTTTSKNKIARQEASIDETRPLPDTQREVQRDLVEPSVLREQNKMNIREENIFFRIWFDLKKKELVKIAIGSFAAAFSGISKPFFGFYIITIGVAYFEEDAKRKVGMYSAIFSGIGLLSLFSHTFQHYFFGVVGEKAMSNFRLALYSGIEYSLMKI